MLNHLIQSAQTNVWKSHQVREVESPDQSAPGRLPGLDCLSNLISAKMSAKLNLPYNFTAPLPPRLNFRISFLYPEWECIWLQLFLSQQGLCGQWTRESIVLLNHNHPVNYMEENSKQILLSRVFLLLLLFKEWLYLTLKEQIVKHVLGNCQHTSSLFCF